MAATKFRTSIIAREVKATFSGRNRAGHDYTLFQVIATKPDGSPIDLNLRSFEELPTNEVVEVEAELYQSEQYGDSYTLSRLGARKSTDKQIEELTKRVETLERQIAELRSRPPEAAGAPPPLPTSVAAGATAVDHGRPF